MKKVSLLVFLLALTLVFSNQATAQEDTSGNISVEVTSEVTTQNNDDQSGDTSTDDNMNDSGMNDYMSGSDDASKDGMSDSGESDSTDEVMISDEISADDLDQILEDADDVSNEVESLDDLEGEIVAILDDVVVLKTDDNEIVKVSKTVYENHVFRSGGASGRRLALGQKVVTGNVVSEGGNLVLKTESGVYTVPSDTKVNKGNSQFSVEEVGDKEVVAVLDKEGNLVSLSIVEELEEASEKVGWTVAIAVVVLILAYLIFKPKSRRESVVESESVDSVDEN